MKESFIMSSKIKLESIRDQLQILIGEIDKLPVDSWYLYGNQCWMKEDSFGVLFNEFVNLTISADRIASQLYGYEESIKTGILSKKVFYKVPKEFEHFSLFVTEFLKFDLKRNDSPYQQKHWTLNKWTSDGYIVGYHTPNCGQIFRRDLGGIVSMLETLLMLEPSPKSQILEIEDQISKMDSRLINGKISEELYNKLSARLEKRLDELKTKE